MDTTDKVLEIPVVEGLEFDDATHTYRLDGLVIPSVSAILGPLSKAKYAGISERTIEDIPPEHIGYFNAFRAWWDEFRPEVVGSEVRICHRLMRYGGTADLVAYIGDELTLVDYKSTYVISDMTCGVQLEAYAQALADMGIRVQRKRILHLKKDGIYSIRDYPANDVNRWRVFGALKTVYDYIESSK